MSYLALTNKNAPAIPPSLLGSAHLQPFHITRTCLDPEVASKRKVPRAFRSVIPTDRFIWQRVFEYLEPRDICKLVVTAKGWSRFLNLKPLMYQYFRLENYCQYNAFKEMISKISVNAPMPFLFLELSSTYNSVESLETFLQEKTTFRYQLSYRHLKMPYSIWFDLVAAKQKQELLSQVTYVNCNLHSAITKIGLRDLFITLRDMSELDLSHIKAAADFESSLQLEKASLPRLKKLKMFGAKTPIHLASLLLAAPHLEELDLREHEAVDCANLSYLAVDSCPNLATIALKFTAIDNEAVRAIMKAAPRLRRIDLTSCFMIEEGLFDSLPQNALLSLDEMILRNTRAKLSDILAFLERAPNVRCLDLGSCHDIQGRVKRFHRIRSLDSLEVINLQYSKIQSRFVRSFLEAVSNVRDLNLNGCKKVGLGGLKHLKPNSLLHLEKIDLGGTNIWLSDFEAFLRAAPNLKSIKIKYCQNLGSGVLKNIKAEKMETLEHLDLSGSKLLKEDFRFLINLAPHIKKITLCEYKGSVISLFENMEDNALASMVEIDLGYTDFNMSDLEILARVAPHLKKINLFGCKNMRIETDAFFPPQFQLAGLKKINLLSTDVTFIEVEYVLRVGGNIQKIVLKSESDISHRITNEELARIPGHIRIRG